MKTLRRYSWLGQFFFPSLDAADTLGTESELQTTLWGHHVVGVEVGHTNPASTIFSVRHVVSHISFFTTNCTCICHREKF
jgi:hypothetical protein